MYKCEKKNIMVSKKQWRISLSEGGVQASLPTQVLLITFKSFLLDNTIDTDYSILFDTRGFHTVNVVFTNIELF